ncbi:MAG: type II toxin-antitoxin system RelB/DinJ family antitoxin [Lactobacillus sp.]
MATKTPIHVNIDKQLKENADELFQELGLNMSTAITIFLKQSVRDQAIPFAIKKDKPNAETIAAIQELEKGKYEGPFDSVKDLMRSLNA